VNQDSELDHLDVNHVALNVQYVMMVHLNALNVSKVNSVDYNAHLFQQTD